MSELSTAIGWLLLGSTFAQALSYSAYIGASVLATRSQDAELGAFIAGLIQLHEDAETWRRLQRAGLAQVARDCSPTAYTEKLRSLCEAPVFA